VSGQQSSVGLGWGHQLRRPGQPAFPAANPSPRQTDWRLLTAHNVEPEAGSYQLSVVS